MKALATHDNPKKERKRVPVLSLVPPKSPKKAKTLPSESQDLYNALTRFVKDQNEHLVATLTAAFRTELQTQLFERDARLNGRICDTDSKVDMMYGIIQNQLRTVHKALERQSRPPDNEYPVTSQIVTAQESKLPDFFNYNKSSSGVSSGNGLTPLEGAAKYQIFADNEQYSITHGLSSITRDNELHGSRQLSDIIPKPLPKDTGCIRSERNQRFQPPVDEYAATSQSSTDAHITVDIKMPDSNWTSRSKSRIVPGKQAPEGCWCIGPNNNQFFLCLCCDAWQRHPTKECPSLGNQKPSSLHRNYDWSKSPVVPYMYDKSSHRESDRSYNRESDGRNHRDSDRSNHRDRETSRSTRRNRSNHRNRDSDRSLHCDSDGEDNHGDRLDTNRSRREHHRNSPSPSIDQSRSNRLKSTRQIEVENYNGPPDTCKSFYNTSR